MLRLIKLSVVAPFCVIRLKVVAPIDLSFMSSPLFVVCCRRNLFLKSFCRKKKFFFWKKGWVESEWNGKQMRVKHDSGSDGKMWGKTFFLIRNLFQGWIETEHVSLTDIWWLEARRKWKKAKKQSVLESDWAREREREKGVCVCVCMSWDRERER